MILVGDIGGTNTRLALASPQGSTFQLEREQHFATTDDLAALAAKYLQDAPAEVEAISFCGAGPVRGDGSIALTNHASILDPKRIAAATGVSRVHLVNDFEAVAQSLPVLPPQALHGCGGGSAIAGAPRLVLGAGTGLGVAALISNGRDWLALPGEGGHVDLAPVDDEEHVVWQQLRASLGRVTAEHVLSGHGLERLYGACGGKPGFTAPQISAAALKGESEAQRAIGLFTRWLGRVSGNLALTLLARGGVYVAGGIVPGWGSHLDIAAFRAGFEDKAPFREVLAAIPVWVITHQNPALLGLARIANSR